VPRGNLHTFRNVTTDAAPCSPASCRRASSGSSVTSGIRRGSKT
jgi:hypothetical protein